MPAVVAASAAVAAAAKAGPAATAARAAAAAAASDADADADADAAGFFGVVAFNGAAEGRRRRKGWWRGTCGGRGDGEQGADDLRVCCIVADDARRTT
jgi:hypothetical protein